MEESILTSIKQMLGIEEDDTDFDLEIIAHINAAFSTLWQIGIGPKDGYELKDKSETWDEYTTSINMLSSIKLYVADRVKLVWDSSTSPSFVVTEVRKDMEEHYWRLSIMADEAKNNEED